MVEEGEGAGVLVEMTVIWRIEHPKKRPGRSKITVAEIMTSAKTSVRATEGRLAKDWTAEFQTVLALKS